MTVVGEVDMQQFVAKNIRWITAYVHEMQRAMNLAYWDIVVHPEPPPPDEQGNPRSYAAASVWRSNTYNDADMYLNGDHIKDRESLRYAVVHELVHLILRDYDNAIESIEDHLNKPAFDIVNKWNYREMERAVDFIARAWSKTLPLPPSGKGLD